MDSVLTWAPYLYAVSLLDGKDLELVNQAAQATANAVAKGQYKKATELGGKMDPIIAKATDTMLHPSLSYNG